MRASGSPVHFVVTATTRPKRETEVHGVDYFFISKPEFERMIAQDELICLLTPDVYDRASDSLELVVPEHRDSDEIDMGM